LLHFAAEKFGVKKFLPAYLDPNIQLPDLLTGVSFASGGSGYDPLTAQLTVITNYFSNLNYTLNFFNCQFCREIFLFIHQFQSSMQHSKQLFCQH